MGKATSNTSGMRCRARQRWSSFRVFRRRRECGERLPLPRPGPVPGFDLHEHHVSGPEPRVSPSSAFSTSML